MDIIINGENRKIHTSLVENPGANKTLIIAPGVGISRHSYRKFAEYFANLRYTVIYFDYTSQPVDHPDVHTIHLKEWGEKDLYCVIEYGRENYPHRPLFMVGHSIAGQLFPLASNCNSVSSCCFIASQNVSIQNWSGSYRWRLQFFWNVVIPFFTFSKGKLPAFAYGGRYDLPRQIAIDWAHWARSRNGVVERVDTAFEAYANVITPAKFFSIADDHLLAPENSVKALFNQYGCKVKELEHINPKKYDLSSMGHADFFRSKFSFLWPKVEGWFNKTS